MVCGITDTALKDGVVTAKTFHPGQSLGDGDEIA